jgi:hypothetical protein
MRGWMVSLSLVTVILGSSISGCGDESDDAGLAEPALESTTVSEVQTIPYFTAYEGLGAEPSMLRLVPRPCSRSRRRWPSED